MQNGARQRVPGGQNDVRQEAQERGRHMISPNGQVVGVVIRERNTKHEPHSPEITVNIGAKSVVQHIVGTCDNMQAYQRNEQFCDITIKVGEISFKAHKLVLASTCEYFRAMFTSGFQESRDAEVSITGTPDGFKILLDFLYTGVLDINPETTTTVITDVLKMAHYLQLSQVVTECENLLVREFSHCNLTDVLQIMSLSDTFELERLKNRCKKFLAQNFDGSDDFLQLMTQELILETMDHQSFIMEEKKVFDVVVAWLKHDWEARKQFAAQLFQKLHLGVVPPGHVTVTFLKTPELNSIPECQEMVVRVMELLDNKRPSDPPLSVSHPDLFQTRTTVTAIIDLCHQHGALPNYFDTKEDQMWKPLPSLPQILDRTCYKYSSCVTANDQLYVARMKPAEGPTTNLLVLDKVNKTWKSLAPMTQNRWRCCLVPHYDNHIYAIGGVRDADDESKKKCEVYVINENRWHEIEPMPRALVVVNSSSAVAYQGTIVVCGEVKVDELNTRSVVMMYNPTQNSWLAKYTSQVRPSLANVLARAPSGIILQNGKVYFVVPTHSYGPGSWGSVMVFEFDIDNVNRRQVPIERVEQTQDAIPEQLRPHMICVDEVLYGYCGGGLHKLDVSVDSIKNEKQFWAIRIGDDACVTTYKFDKTLYM